MRYDKQAARDAYIKQRDETRQYVEQLIAHADLLDDDGYPTEACLEAISKWHFSDEKGWFDFIRQHWHLASWGWSEGEEDHEYREGEKVYRYHLSTGGWSGNEGIIKAMQANEMMWMLNWFQSRRGGHYIFEQYTVRDDDE
mgnify:FL=1